MYRTLIILLTTLIFQTLSLFSKDYTLLSPDRQIRLEVSVDQNLEFTVFHNGQVAFGPGQVSMTLSDRILGENPKIKRTQRNTIDEHIELIVPNKDALIHDHCNELTLLFNKHYSVVFRAYNDGVAYRFVTSFKNDIDVVTEKMEISFPENTTTWFPEESSFISHYERQYQVLNIKDILHSDFCSLPVLFRNPEEINVLFTEADLYDYPGMFIFGSGGNSVHCHFPHHVLEAGPLNGNSDRSEEIIKEADFIARTDGNRTFPWRVFIISDQDKDLIESNLVLQLSRPLKLKDTDWIKPGKVAWDWWNANNIRGVDFRAGINNDTYKYYIDFASEFGIEYIILDEGWSKTTTNLLECNPDIDVRELCDYGKEKGVGVILWALWKPLDKNMDAILDSFASWGVQGIKVDFMQRIDQAMVNYYEKVCREAAKREMTVDFHGAFKPAGLRRAYPNLFTYEGLQGAEHNKWGEVITPEHNLTLPFIRMVAGPMDYTPGAMDNANENNFHPRWTRPMSMGTRCHQAAMYVVYESPLQMLCDSPSNYYKEKESTAFIARIPTTWDETIVLDAKISDYIVIARRDGEKWYIAAMTDNNPRKFDLDLDFLPEGKFKMEIMKDGINADRDARDYKLEELEFDSRSKIKINLAAGGGWVGIISQ